MYSRVQPMLWPRHIRGSHQKRCFSLVNAYCAPTAPFAASAPFVRPVPSSRSVLHVRFNVGFPLVLLLIKMAADTTAHIVFDNTMDSGRWT